MTPARGRTAPTQFRILICDDLDPEALAILRRRGFEPEVAVGLAPAALCERVRDAHALVVRSATQVTRQVLEAAPRLVVVGRAGVGVDNVDTDAATERGVVVMNTPSGNTITTAELTLALLFAVARHVPRGDRLVRAGGWSKKGLTGTELTGKTLGIVGLGRIGRAVAERAQGLRMRVLGHDPFLAEAAEVRGVEIVDLDALLAAADFVTLHVPRSEATRNLLSRERIFAMKPGARLVNAARGGLVDEAALLEALDQGHLAGAALDVLAEEPPRAGHPLVARDDVVVTPHLGASSHEAQRQVAIDVAHQIADFLLEGVAHNAVNAPAVSAQELARLAPWVLLADRLGSFLAQQARSPIVRLELSLSGEIAGLDTRHLPLALLSGVLREDMDLGVNYVNAPILARERGLELFERSVPEDDHFHARIAVRAYTRDGASHAAAGTVLGRTPRIVEADGLRLDLEPRGTLLITRHRDEAGVVGKLGTLLGDLGVNIRRIELGPAQDGGLATGFLSLYGEAPVDLLERVLQLPQVAQARLLRLG